MSNLHCADIIAARSLVLAIITYWPVMHMMKSFNRLNHPITCIKVAFPRPRM